MWSAKRGRTISRSKDQDFLDTVDARTQENMDKYLQRQMIVEHPFETIKRSMNAGYYLCRGMESVFGEASLILLAYNFKRLNHNMPSMDGFEVLNMLKSDERYKKFHIIIFTNSEDCENEIKGLELGAADYIRKPIRIESLKARINVHLELLSVHKLYEEMLLNSDTLDTILNQAPVGIAISHNNESFYYGNNDLSIMNSVFTQIVGRSKEEIRQLGWYKITHPDDLDKDVELFKELQLGKINSYSMEKRYVKKDGYTVWVDIVVARLNLNDNYKYSYITIIQDISVRKAHEIDFKYLSEHDTLTGLYNRKFL